MIVLESLETTVCDRHSLHMTYLHDLLLLRLQGEAVS